MYTMKGTEAFSIPISHFQRLYVVSYSFPGDLVVKNPPANARDTGSIPGLGRSPGEGNGNPLQCSYLGNPMDRGAWRVSPWGPKELDMTE